MKFKLILNLLRLSFCQSSKSVLKFECFMRKDWKGLFLPSEYVFGLSYSIAPRSCKAAACVPRDPENDIIIFGFLNRFFFRPA